MSKQYKTGFIPDGKAKRLLANSNVFSNICAYVYPDGVAVFERRQVREGKYKGEVKIWHLFPCEIRFIWSNYHELKAISHLVVHNPSLLVDGLTRVEVYYNNTSQNMEEKNIFCTSITLHTQSGMLIRQDQYSFHSGDVVVFPNTPEVDRFNCTTTFTQKGLKWIKQNADFDEYVEVYGEFPPDEEPTLNQDGNWTLLDDVLEPKKES